MADKVIAISHTLEAQLKANGSDSIRADSQALVDPPLHKSFKTSGPVLAHNHAPSKLKSKRWTDVINDFRCSPEDNGLDEIGKTLVHIHVF